MNHFYELPDENESQMATTSLVILHTLIFPLCMYPHYFVHCSDGGPSSMYGTRSYIFIPQYIEELMDLYYNIAFTIYHLTI